MRVERSDTALQAAWPPRRRRAHQELVTELDDLVARQIPKWLETGRRRQFKSFGAGDLALRCPVPAHGLCWHRLPAFPLSIGLTTFVAA